ncbi:MAG: putative transposase [Cryobacterium sp.]|nr:putative transposase [Cryobacterium sp.]
MSEVIGGRWFREGGGMPPMTLAEPTGRYLSFVEREEIAILRAQGHGPREIGRRIGRNASTISRASPERGHAIYEPGVPGNDRSVEGRDRSEAPERSEAGDEPEAA